MPVLAAAPALRLPVRRGPAYPGQRCRHGLGFTLIELLIVLAIIAILLGLLLPAIQKIRESASRTRCANSMRQFGIAIHNRYNDYNNIPPAYFWTQGRLSRLPPPAPPPPGRDDGFKKSDRPPPASLYYPILSGWGWGCYLLPYLEQNSLYQQIDFATSTVGPQALPIRTTILSAFVCPSDSSTGLYTVLNGNGIPLVQAATNSYASCYGAAGNIGTAPNDGNGMFVGNGKFLFSDVSDGLSNTIAIGERANLFCQVPWVGVLDQGTVNTTAGAPVYQSLIYPPPTMAMARFYNKWINDPMSEPFDFFTPHPSGMNLLYGDGSVRPASVSVSIDVLCALATRAGGEIVDLP